MLLKVAFLVFVPVVAANEFVKNTILAKEDECFYDVVSCDNSQDASYYSFPTRSLKSNFETNMSGLAMDCKQISKSDQVPELNETYLLEGKKQ